MTQIRVVYDSYRYVTREENPDDSWSRDNTDADYTIRAVSESGNYFDLVADFELDASRSYHLLYMIYDTGDSFGTDGGQIEFIMLYQDLNVAHTNRQRLVDHYESPGDSHTVALVSDSGEECQIGVPYMGYFETLRDVEVKTVVVE